MLIKHLLIAFLLILISSTTNLADSDDDNDNDDDDHCDDKHDAIVHRSCTHRTLFSKKEIETVKKYIQDRFRKHAIIKPQRKPCKELKVYRDFKCLTHSERVEWVNAFIKLYRNGVINNITYTHGTYWPFLHLMAQTMPYHNKILTVAQNEIEKIDPRINTPYWNPAVDFGAPERSIIWDYIGRAGNQQNDYCIPNGLFGNLIVKYPEPHCIRREWNIGGTIPSWESPEVLTWILQQGISNTPRFISLTAPQHFKKHLNSGGYNGDHSFVWATNDPVFWLFHQFEWGQLRFKMQLQNDSNLTPLAYDNAGKHEPPYQCNGRMVASNMVTDRVLGYDSTLVEQWQIGFGDSCYIQDEMVEVILNVVNDRRPTYPEAVNRLRRALPPNVFAEYFPKFADNTANQFNYILPDIGNKGNRRCRPLPVPPRFSSTPNGRRQFDGFKQCDRDIQSSTLESQDRIESFINTLNAYGYCSPYL